MDDAWRSDDDDDDEFDEDAEPVYGEDDQPAIVPCPFCRGDVLEDSPRCPHCERYLTDEDHARSGTPTWVIVTAVICLAAAIATSLVTL